MSTDRRILDAALLVIEEAGIRGATMRRIADEAGVNEVTLFRRYGSKERLLLTALQRRGDQEPVYGLPLTPKDPVGELEAWALAHLNWLVHARPLLRSAMNEQEAHPEVCSSAQEGPMRVAAELVRYLEALRACGLASGDWNPSMAAWMLMGALFSEAMGRDLPGRPQRPPAEVAHHYVHLFTRAIGVGEATVRC